MRIRSSARHHCSGNRVQGSEFTVQGQGFVVCGVGSRCGVPALRAGSRTCARLVALRTPPPPCSGGSIVSTLTGYDPAGETNRLCSVLDSPGYWSSPGYPVARATRLFGWDHGPPLQTQLLLLPLNAISPIPNPTPARTLTGYDPHPQP